VLIVYKLYYNISSGRFIGILRPLFRLKKLSESINPK